MIPILFDTNETAFTSNGIGRLRDCISCTVTEERNGIYECDFEYPIDGANYDLIQIGRIIGVTHDDTGDIQPFDIVSFEKPIDGVVTFHCTHISYRQSYMTVTGSNINSLSGAFTLFASAQPTNPFNYQTDKTSTGYLASADGVPRTVRQMLGGIEGSILDAYGGEYEWDRWNVILHASRGQIRDFSIRYGVNMLEYNDEVDSSGAFSSCIPYWTNGEVTVVATKVDSGSSTPTGRGECVPLDLSEKFEDAPTTTQLRNAATSYMSSNQSYLPAQTINVSFVRLQDMGEYADYQNLLRCELCDTINVIFPDYGTSGNFKIVRTVWNALDNRYDEMELGSLSTTLSEALGISDSLDKSANTFNNLSVINDLSVGDDITADTFYSEKSDGVAFEQKSDGSGGGEAGIKLHRTDQSTTMTLAIGTNGNTHGIYSNKNSRWMIYDDASGITKIPANSATVHGYTIGTRETITSQSYDTPTSGLTVNGSSTSSQLTQTQTKSGYYPLGIVGHQLLGSQAVNLTLIELQMSARASGSVTVRYRIRNNASSNSTNTYIHYWVLWIKE